jgi:hypothetical protein
VTQKASPFFAGEKAQINASPFCTSEVGVIAYKLMNKALLA